MKDISAQMITEALERDEFELYYQPQVDLKTESIVGMEALLRWRHRHNGLIGPVELIAAAERTGQI